MVKEYGQRVAGGLLLAAVLVLWTAVALPLALGDRTFFQRDVFGLHVSLKWMGAQALREGDLPAFQPQWALGQPFRGNPNAVAFYPGNLLYLLLPFWSAFNLHFALHWLLAFFTMRWLARELGQSNLGAFVSALTYAGCGWMLTCLTFYSTLATVAWWPVVLIGARRGGARGTALGGIAAGMAFLAGEPITALLGLVPLLLVSIEGKGLRRGVVTAAAIVTIGTLIALPQLVATLRILSFTVRGTGGLSPSTAYTMHPVRLVELFVPLPFGVPVEMGPTGYLRQRFGEPYIYSLHFGVVGAWLASLVWWRRWPWAALAAAGALLAMAGGALASALHTLSRGVFRYPEKFLFWFALAAALLAGWGLDQLLERSRGSRHALLQAVAVAVAVLAITLRAWSGAALAWLATGETLSPDARDQWAQSWAVTLATAALLLVLASWCAQRRAGHLLVALQFVGLLGLGPLIETEATEFYRQPALFASHLPARAAVAMSTLDSPFGTPRPVYQLPAGDRRYRRFFWRIGHLDLDYPTGVIQGLHYPFATDIDKLMTPLTSLLLEQLPRLEWSEQVRWMRICGLDALTLIGAEDRPGLRRIETVNRYGVPTSLYAVEDPLPPVWWPESVETVPSQLDTLRRVGRLADLRRVAFVGQPVAHRAHGAARLVAADRDRIEVEVESQGGVFVLRRAYHPLLIARTGTQRLESFPADVALTGIAVPPGRHRVVLEVSNVPELAAGAVALTALGACLIVVLRPGALPRSGDRSGVCAGSGSPCHRL